jgi:hypothetical protein
MSYKQRERKRRKKAAMAKEQSRARARPARSGSSPSAWWLTVVTRDTCCAKCAGILRTEGEMVYRATPREALCKLCAEDLGICARPSTRWELSRRRVREPGLGSRPAVQGP